MKTETFKNLFASFCGVIAGALAGIYVHWILSIVVAVITFFVAGQAVNEFYETKDN